MIRRPADITIEEPPIEKLTRQHSCLRRSCFSCLSFLLIILGISLLILKFTLNAQTKELKKIPAEISRAVPVYDPDNIESISLTAGSERSRGVEMAAFLPKLMVAPIILTLDRGNNIIKTYRPDVVNQISEKTSWFDKFLILIKTNVADHRDEIRLEWKKLPTDAKFIQEYYDTELKKQGFIITSHSDTEHIRQFTFSKNGIEGSVYTEDNPTTPETDTVILTITMTATSTQNYVN
ncbi:MAG: hypothetical protein A2821_00720 [Candidatus Magasanikbacteria bacterium RIFCSPHIGHO2_01_FULL_41_23]|uniref:Uncharacterized protein n=1 Tax=Candidatus Magasanikbacteria bacterium RIFCSPLOWO2_01_FULL_40_15 TaxID=1798686 RepID=A0A1F6N0K8_9BACT|nr:MAG: hypothetical protein A2821_00720 [Candidatus Magasanikbacteria bacterium RIFCSPHIGHO2_01_FULL_41_23]OGH74697.1 MAG: hypothetical protein A3F22_02075 [Candidatus Magasanikbacteria bacterium RIFCSPHIGHO2_12_FULL_41_16]OGH77411.1 MAG: hypothetical protein A2983_01775 [Candidatus Magasanikbacteria bacterium RIFCSPLOWO2_01_FULL_40_15]